MKKRIIPILIVMAALIGLLVIPANAAETGNMIQAGYNKVTIDPYNYPGGALNGLPMGGYGAVTERLSGTKPDTAGSNETIAFVSDARMDDNGDGKLDSEDGLFATCTAITDKNGKTLIHFGVDNTNVSTVWTNQARISVAQKLQSAGYNISQNNIFITASHSHSTPQLTFSGISGNEELTNKVTAYREWVFSQMGDAAVAAMQDREPVTLKKAAVDASDAIAAMGGNAKQQRMNWVRHYKGLNSSGETIVSGSNFGNGSTTGNKEVSAPNDVMQLVQLTPVSGGKDPILLINWTAHATINSNGSSSGYSTKTYGRYHYYSTSADYVGALRSSLETGACFDTNINSKYFSKVSSTQTYRVSFISGAAGNVTPTTSVMTSSQDPDVLVTDTTIGYKDDPAGHLYGQKLAAIARYGLDNYLSDALDNTGDIRIQTKTFTYDIHKASDFDTAFIKALKSYKVDSAGNISETGTKNLLSYLTTNSTTWAKKNNAAYTQLTYTYNNETYDFTYLKKFTSRYQLSNMNSRATDTRDIGSMPVSVITIGENLAITVNPCELADRFSESATLASATLNDWEDLNDPTYGTPLIMGYTNGSEGYVPNKLAYNYNSGANGDGADIGDKHITGSYESSGAEFAAGTGEKLVKFYKDMLSDLKNGAAAESRFQCECGGTAVGKPGHTCMEVEFLPWTETTFLPVGGNYYLTEDVVLSRQFELSNILSLDLNGHSITYKVAAGSSNTRVFSLTTGAYLSVTDSTAEPGMITRDLSNLTTTQKKAITNYGLLILINDTASATLYNGVLDATGMYSGGGSCVSLQAANTSFKMYGGTMKGGISDNGVVYNSGNAEFYGGTVTGGVTKAAGGKAGGIRVVSNGKVTLGGSVVIKDNKKSNGNPVNIRFDTESKMATNFIVKGAFTGEASFYCGGTRTSGMVVGKSENASFAPANLHQDINKDFDVAVSGDDIILTNVKYQCVCGGKAVGMSGHTCEDVVFLPWLDTASLPNSGYYYLTDNVTTTAQTTLTGALQLDLNGYGITYQVAAGSKDTRVFRVESGASLSITDSTANPGAITRDLSQLTDDQKSAISNSGLLILVCDNADVTVYDGIFDSVGAATTGSGSCISSYYAGSHLTIYGGTYKGGTAKYGGVLHNKGTVNMYGGTFAEGRATTGGLVANYGTFNMYDGMLTGGCSDSGGAVYNGGTAGFFGGTVTGNKTVSNGTCPGIYVGSNNGVPGKLTIGGCVVIDENRKTANNVEMNIRYVSVANMASNFTISGDFTGKAGVYVATRAIGQVIGISDDASFTPDNFKLDYNKDFDIVVNGKDIVLANIKYQCECGGKATDGKYGHTCEKVIYLPWTDTATLPSSGNYYLTDNVTTTAQMSVTGTLRLDLNGFTVAHKVAAGASSTRVFSLSGSAYLAVTDSSNAPGTVTRDLSDLTAAQKTAITNYGLLFLLNDSASATLYNGTLDATGMYSGGGSCVSLQGANTSFKMYGGTMKGGITDNGVVYVSGNAEFYGGTVTGGVTKIAGGKAGGIRVLSSGKLTIGGSVVIKDNKKSNGNPINIRFDTESKMATNFIVKGAFTGEASFYCGGTRTNGMVVGKSENASFTSANLHQDVNKDFQVAVSGDNIILTAPQ